MACAITKGRSLPCKNSVGGLKAIYILDYSATVAALTDTNGTIIQSFLNLTLKVIQV